MNNVVKWATVILGSRRFLASVVAVGIVLRVVRFAANRSLWGDEGALALNVLIKPLSQLLHPLDFLQGAPSGYLIMQKGVTTLLGVDEYSLRLVALVSGIASLVLFALVARRLLEAPAAGLAVFLFAVSERLVYYSSEVKQYSTDTAVATVLLLGAVAVGRRRVTAPVVAVVILVGSALVWFSHPALIVRAVSPSRLAAGAAPRRGLPKAFAGSSSPPLVIGMSGALAYAVSRRNTQVVGEAALGPGGGEDGITSPFANFWDAFADPVGVAYSATAIAAAVTALGVFVLIRTECQRCFARCHSDCRHSHCCHARSLPV